MTGSPDSVTTVKEKRSDVEVESLLLGALDAKRARNERTGPRDLLYVSEVGTVAGESACWRKLFYAYHDAPKDPMPADTLMAFEVGDIVGLRVANLLAETGEVQKIEYRLNFDPWPVSGRFDILLSDRLRRIIDVKTCPIEQQPYLPKMDHLQQINLYQYALRRDPDFAGIGATLLYVFKNARKGQPVMRSIVCTYDERAAMIALDTFTKARVAATGGVLPERPQGYTPSKFPCGYCSFKTHCWSGREVR